MSKTHSEQCFCTRHPRIGFVNDATAGVELWYNIGIFHSIMLTGLCKVIRFRPNASDILQKLLRFFSFFALLACQTALWNPNSCLMVLMHHLNADPSVKRGWGWVVACGEGIHRIWKSDDRGCAQNADAVLEWNIKLLESLLGDFGAWVPKQEGSVNKQVFKAEIRWILNRWAVHMRGGNNRRFYFFEDEELVPHTETQHD